MTLIISVGNSEQFIQISDRRLSVNGRMQDDESNKAVVLNCANARLAFGFTGLARVSNFETREWLLSNINESGPPDYLAQSVLERVKEKITKLFRDTPAIRSLPKDKRRLTVMFSGYLYHHDPPLGCLAILTNFQNIDFGVLSTTAWDHFECFYREEPRPYEDEPALFYAIGSAPPISEINKSKLVLLLKTRKPAKAIVGTLVNIFHELSESPHSKGSIGKQLTSIILSRDRNDGAESAYHSDVVKNETYMPDQIYIVSKHLHLNVKDVKIEPVFPEDTPPMSGPKLRPNQPCWCNSGKKYKYCHGQKSKQMVKFKLVATPDKEEK